MNKERRIKLANLLLDFRAKIIKKEPFDLREYIKQIEALFT